MANKLDTLFSVKHNTRAYRVTFTDGERYVLTAVVCFGGLDEEEQAAGRVVNAIIRRAEAERHFIPGKVMSFPLHSVREVVDEATGELLYRAV